MGHRSATGPIDGVGKPGVQHLLVIDSLSDLLGGAWAFSGPSTEQLHREPQAQGATCCLTGEMLQLSKKCLTSCFGWFLAFRYNNMGTKIKKNNSGVYI